MGYINNLEVGRISAFQTPVATKFRQAVLQNAGIYKHRWGDAILRRMSLALEQQSESGKHSHNVQPLGWLKQGAYCHAVNGQGQGCPCLRAPGEDLSPIKLSVGVISTPLLH